MGAVKRDCKAETVKPEVEKLCSDNAEIAGMQTRL